MLSKVCLETGTVWFILMVCSDLVLPTHVVMNYKSVFEGVVLAIQVLGKSIILAISSILK